MGIKKYYKFPKGKDIDEKISRTKRWSGEKTDAKTIKLLIDYGFGKLFGG